MYSLCKIEDEIHFLIERPLYEIDRNKLFQACETVDREIKEREKFDKLVKGDKYKVRECSINLKLDKNKIKGQHDDKIDKLIYLMCHQSNIVLNKVAFFIMKALNLRKNFLKQLHS